LGNYDKEKSGALVHDRSRREKKRREYRQLLPKKKKTSKCEFRGGGKRNSAHGV